MLNFNDSVLRAVEQIPEKRYATYGDIARALGDVRAARAVRAVLDWRRKIDGMDRLTDANGNLYVGGHVDIANVTLFNDFDIVPILSRLRQEQLDLAPKVSLEPMEGIDHVAGFDVGYRGSKARGALVIFDHRTKERIDAHTCEIEADFPYIATYLAFRELPAFEPLISFIPENTVVMVDGNGILHPHRFGVACHIGVKFGLPTIGIAKRQLGGSPRNPGIMAGSSHVLEVDGEARGYAMRGARGKAIYVSPGHLTDMGSSLEVVRRFHVHRVPEPVREAHMVAGGVHNP